MLRSENRDRANDKRRRQAEEEQYRRDCEAEAEASKLTEWIYSHMGDQIRDMQGLPLHTECVICGNPLPPGRQMYCCDKCALLGSMAKGRWMRARRKRGRDGSPQ